MSAFRWFNLVGDRSLIGSANASGSTAITNVTSTATSEVFNEQVYGSSGLTSLVLDGTVDVNTPDAAVSASASQVTDANPGLLFTNTTANGFALGLVVQFTTSTTLPTGISAATDYYVIPVTTTTYFVATSLANALAGTAVDYTNTGTGDQTATPVALAGATLILQASNDNEATWSTVPNSTWTITADGSFKFELDYIRYASFRAYVAMTTGMLTFSKLQISYRGGE